MLNRILFLLLFSAFLTSCNEDDDMGNLPLAEPKLAMTFTPMYEGAEMDLFTRYNNVHDCSFELSELKFYLANITLHRANGDTSLLSDIEFINIRTDLNSLEFDIPHEDFSAISFDLGVPVELNGTQNPDFLTSIYSLDHPLSASNGTYWTWQTGYRFFMVEGRLDTVPDSAENLATFAFHTGRDTLFRALGTYQRAISGAGGARNELKFALDFERFFATETDTVNLRYDRDFHGMPSQMELGHRVANNSAALFRLLP